MIKDTSSILTKPTSPPISNKTLASEAPKLVASSVNTKVVLVSLMLIVSISFVNGAALSPIPATIDLFPSDHASKVSVYESPFIISVF